MFTTLGLSGKRRSRKVLAIQIGEGLFRPIPEEALRPAPAATNKAPAPTKPRQHVSLSGTMSGGGGLERFYRHGRRGRGKVLMD